MRGHALIWPGFDNMPADTATLSPSALAARIDGHFEREEGALGDDVYEWNVVNEPYGSHDVQGLLPGVANVTASSGVLGNPSIAHWYALAETVEAGPRRFLNDYGLLESKDPVQEAYDLALVKYIQAKGGDVQGLGFESHFYQTGPDFIAMQATLNDFDPYIGAYGVTEFDFTNLDLSLQADMTRDYMTFIFGQPKFDEFLMWGFWDGAHWLKSAPIYTLDWSIKPSGKVWRTLTQTTWRTHATGHTDAKGNYTARAFKGKYTVSAKFQAKTCAVPFTLSEDSSVTLRIDCD
jgi:GH35 family endo-1,4-beta-xylanase